MQAADVDVRKKWCNLFTYMKLSPLSASYELVPELEDEFTRVSNIGDEIKTGENNERRCGKEVYQQTVRLIVSQIYKLSKQREKPARACFDNIEKIIQQNFIQNASADKQTCFGALRYIIIELEPRHFTNETYQLWATIFSTIWIAEEPATLTRIHELCRLYIDADELTVFSAILMCIHKLYNILPQHMSESLHNFFKTQSIKK